MATIEDLRPLVTEPNEDLGVEYKDWLDLSTNAHRAKVAKAAIALVNHGGGFIVIGFEEVDDTLVSHERPDATPVITQDAINAAVRRYADPAFHCTMYSVPHPVTGVVHPVIVVPGTLTEPVMSKRDCEGEIVQARCYIRKPGPISEEPRTREEWRGLLSRCVRAGRDDMLEAIRAIVSGRAAAENVPPDAMEDLRAFCEAARIRWEALAADLPPAAPQRLRHGYYEMAFSLVGAAPIRLADLREKLDRARRIKLTGWSPFLSLGTPEWAPYVQEDYIEAWVGRPVAGRADHDSSHSDFWRAARDGRLYTIRGYSEDALDNRPPGRFFDVTMPVWRVGEGLLFARRLAEEFGEVEAIAVRCNFTGLADRRLASVTGRRDILEDRVCRTAAVVVETQATPAQIDDNLVEVLHQLLTPLYERFDFFQLPLFLVDEEINSMARNRF